MKITEAIFAGSSTDVTKGPEKALPEFAFIGRSNVGKSSLINMLCGNRKLAQTSSTPGKTKLINRFLINQNWYLVDLPGYGYAKLPMSERQKLTKIIEGYIRSSSGMVLLFVLIDSRHEIGKIDLDFLINLGNNGIPFSIIFTKCDKSGPNARKAMLDATKAKLLEFWEELPPVFESSAENGMGKEEILGYIDEVLKTINT